MAQRSGVFRTAKSAAGESMKVPAHNAFFFVVLLSFPLLCFALSLSWQNDPFEYGNGAVRGVFRTVERAAAARDDLSEALEHYKKTRLVFEFSLCSSRACLRAKMTILVEKVETESVFLT